MNFFKTFIRTRPELQSLLMCVLLIIIGKCINPERIFLLETVLAFFLSTHGCNSVFRILKTAYVSGWDDIDTGSIAKELVLGMLALAWISGSKLVELFFG